MKIDIFAHVCPKRFIDYFSRHVIEWEKLTGTDRVGGSPALWDIDKRLEIMDRYEDYVQVLVPTQPAAETFCSPKNSPQLAKVYNDAMAEIISKHPDRFVGAVAYLPLNNIDATLKEIDRAIDELGFKGIALDTPIYKLKKPGQPALGYDYQSMKPIDSPEFMPIYEAMSKRKLPIWLHPKGEGGLPVYQGEVRNRYALSAAIGWPVESAMAMCRLVYSGIIKKYPDLTFIIHHCGSIVIPALAGRLNYYLTRKVDNQDGEQQLVQAKPSLADFRMFFGDTATYGDVTALMLGYNFLGVDHILLGTDSTFGEEDGEYFIRQTIDAINKMEVSDSDKDKIFSGNAKRILRLN